MSEEQANYQTRAYRQKYRLVEALEYTQFVAEVNALLDAGWLLHGATQVVITPGAGASPAPTYFQAMIRYQVDDEDDHRISQAALGEIATAMTRLSDSARVG